VLRAGWFQKEFPVGTWREGEALVNEMDWGGGCGRLLGDVSRAERKSKK